MNIVDTYNNLSIEEVNKYNKEEYVNYINSREDTSFVDCWEWREVVERTYNLPHYWYMARKGSQVLGVLCLTITDHPIFGKYLATAPFGTQGGFYADSEESFHALLGKAETLSQELKVKYTLVRHLLGEVPPPADWYQDSSYATYHLSIESDLETYFKNQLSSHRRSVVKRSFKKEHRAEFGHIKLLDDFWDIISRCMKEMGSPYHSKKYLENIMITFGSKSIILVLYNNKSPIGCGLFIRQKNRLDLIHAIFLKEYRPAFAGEFLYWSIIEESYRQGIKVLDIGRSLVGSGNEDFKMHWHPKKILLGYWYKLPVGGGLPHLNQKNQKYQLAIKTWQRLPLPIIRKIGPSLIRGIL